MARRKGKPKQKTDTGAVQEEGHKACPHSFVFNRGEVGRNVKCLIKEMRRVMEPFTASHLKTNKKNVLKDFVSVAGVLNVSHFIMFSKSETSVNLRIARLPRGPTLTFQVPQYSLAKDIFQAQRKTSTDPNQYLHHPLLVMNNFSGEGKHMKLMATMFQNMFPSINVNKVKLKSIRRCVLLNYNAENDTIDFRHYHIRAVPTGLSRTTKKLLKSKIPNLQKYQDVSEFMTRGDVSESEGEMDGPHNEVVLPQEVSGKGNAAASKSAIRLTEIGPRLTLRLVKIEEGVAEGAVLYHQFITLTDEEIAAAAKRRQRTKKLKAERKKNQETNIKKKQELKEDNKKRSLAAMKRKTEKNSEDSASDVDDSEYYRQEVGAEPEPELFPKHGSKGTKRKFKGKMPSDDPIQTDKKQKLSDTESSPSKGQEKFSKKNPSKGKGQKVEGFNNKKRDSKTGDNKKDNQHGEKRQGKKKFLTEVDRLRRGRIRKNKRTQAKQKGKRANKPRNC